MGCRVVCHPPYPDNMCDEWLVSTLDVTRCQAKIAAGRGPVHDTL
jgi:hypothetical protein